MCKIATLKTTNRLWKKSKQINGGVSQTGWYDVIKKIS